MNGHTGLENRSVASKETENFKFVLGLLTTEGRKDFFIHVQPKVITPKYGPKILERLGFEKFDNCPLLGGECYCGHLIKFSDDEDTKIAHQQFHKFVEKLPPICSMIVELDKLLADCGLKGFI